MQARMRASLLHARHLDASMTCCPGQCLVARAQRPSTETPRRNSTGLMSVCQKLWRWRNVLPRPVVLRR
jgi:hypothetical protein